MSTDDHLPVAFSDYDQALLKFIQGIPGRWKEIDFDGMTQVEQTALTCLCFVGLCELRLPVEVQGPGGQAAILCEVSGLYSNKLEREIWLRLSPCWGDVQYTISPGDPVATRSTDAMQEARRSVSDGAIDFILAWVKTKENIRPGYVKSKSCTVNGQADGSGNVTAQAAAQAIGGDTTVNNQVVVNVQPQPAPVAPAPEPTPAEASPPPAPTMVRFTKTEAAKYVGIDVKTLDRWIKNHKILWTDVGDMQIEFNLAELDAHRAIKKKAD